MIGMKGYFTKQFMTAPEDLAAWATAEHVSLSEQIKDKREELDGHRLELAVAREMVGIANGESGGAGPLLVAWCGREDRFGNSPWSAEYQVKDSEQWITWCTEKLESLTARKLLVWDAICKSKELEE